MRSGRLPVLVVTMALLTSGCSFLLIQNAHPGAPGDALRIVAPAHGTQLADVSAVAATLDVSGIEAASLQVLLSTGSSFGAGADVTGRFALDAGTATATLGTADFQPGLTRLVASGTPLGGGDRVQRDAVWSWEPAVDVSAATECEFLGQSRCELPFPSDWFTVADPATATGRRVHFDPATLATNSSGVPIDPTEWNRNDGFSPGSPSVLLVPGVDLAVTGAAPITDIGRSLESNQPIVLLDADTGERYPFFAEVDANAPDDAHRALIIRPAHNFSEGHRIIVALRNLKRSDGSVIPASRAFQVYRDEIPTFLPALEGRRPAMRELFTHLAAAGVARDDLFLAWDFTVASERSLSERMLHIRDDALATLAGGAPGFTVNTVQDNVSSSIFRRVTGTYQVPLYLTGTGAPGSRFQYTPGAGPDALPVRNGTFNAPFTCNIPRSVTTSASGPVTPGRALVYGHGLLGSGSEVNSFGSQANTTRMVMCATNWIGMSTEDIANVVAILGELSKFPSLADRVQQSFLNMIFLARLMKSPSGFVANAAFQAGTPASGVIQTGEVFFNGNSQGGILGGGATAVSTEWTRAVLGVPGMNFSTLLQRSSHWNTFGPISNAAYPDKVDQVLGHAFVQMLWDRAEANGYAQHMTDDPLPNTPAHTVMLVEAFGDFQVANIATETEARTIGASVWQPSLRPGRSTDVVPMWNIPAVPTTPFSGSVLLVWDYNTPAPPIANIPPSSGTDPHTLGAVNSLVMQQIDQFLRPGGAFIDFCGGDACHI